eukprot:TRINITY_DN59775_c0_g1_i1.p1 TRINITY_DN59775_c0_g1~~TRINITY_DN59775_c0_g1_i1.p1  ORF type:complete len:357 (+),score=54.63 TRINITY_DN59775_c0_g1_i1:74-1072(+)
MARLLAASTAVAAAFLPAATGAPVTNLTCPENLDTLDNANCGDQDPVCPLREPFYGVDTKTDGVFRYVTTSYCPPYDWSCVKSPQGRRPCARRTTFKIPLYPSVAEEKIPVGLGGQKINVNVLSSPSEMPPLDVLPSVPFSAGTPMLGAIGVLLNGVALNGMATKLSEALPAGQTLSDLGKEDGWVDAVLAERWMDDHCLGHLSGAGNYHTHAGLWHTPELRKACGLPEDKEGNHSELLGWAFDGYGLYGPLDEGGVPVDVEDLDECGGHSQAKIGGYHYHLLGSYPYSMECFHGCPEPSNNHRFKDRKCSPALRMPEPLQPPEAKRLNEEL